MTTYQVFNSQQSAVASLADADTIPVFDASAGVSAKATVAQMRAAMGGVVATTATTLSITAASHAGKMVVINSAAPIAVTLPAATGTGNVYTFKFGVVATATASTIAALTTDVIEGMSIGVSDGAAAVLGYLTSATSDKISANGTTQGGYPGDRYVFVDAESGVWQVNGTLKQTGTEETPFSAT